MDKLHKEPTLNRFSFHPLDDGREIACRDMLRWAADLALRLEALVPDGREKALALTKLEECVMWANAGIARG